MSSEMHPLPKLHLLLLLVGQCTLELINFVIFAFFFFVLYIIYSDHDFCEINHGFTTNKTIWITIVNPW